MVKIAAVENRATSVRASSVSENLYSPQVVAEEEKGKKN